MVQTTCHNAGAHTELFQRVLYIIISNKVSFKQHGSLHKNVNTKENDNMTYIITPNPALHRRQKGKKVSVDTQMAQKTFWYVIVSLHRHTLVARR